MKFFKKRSNLLITGIVLVALIGGAWYFTQPSAADETAVPALQTAKVRVGDLVIVANGAGEVIPSAEWSLGFEESGTVSEILVGVGEKVEAGQVLARLQTDETEEAIAVNLANAELAVLIAQQDLDEIYTNHRMEVAQALLAVEEAQTILYDLNHPEAKLAEAWLTLINAQEALVAAQADRTNLDYARADALTIENAYADYLLAKEAYEEAVDAFNAVEHKAITDPARARALENLVTTEDKMALTLATYNWLISSATDTDIAIADAELAVTQANLTAAQAVHDQLAKGPTPGEISLAEATLAAAQTRYDQIKEAPDALEVTIAEAKLASAKADLALAQEKRATLDLTSPIGATVTDISVRVGESIGTGAVITVADLDHPLLEVYLDETDLASGAVGNKAEVIFDAYPDEIFHGIVIEISPVLQNVGDVSVVKMLVQLTDYTRPTLPAGLSASVDVIAAEARGALIVPVQALRELTPGSYAVFVVAPDGQLQMTPVEVGVRDFANAEILSGLKVGDVVSTGTVETK
jgi:HlyD family secretion protein